MKKNIAILSCAFAVSVLTFGMLASNLDSKETRPVEISKTRIKAASAKADRASASASARASAKSSVTKKQPAAKEVDKAPLAAPSGITVTGETISWEVLAGGGQFGTSTNFGLSGTIGEAAVGDGFSTNFGVLGGFEQNFSSGPTACCALAGDASGDGRTNIADVQFVIAWLFLSGSDPSCCAQASANGDNRLNIGDATFIIAWLFSGGSNPVCGPVDMTC